MKKTEGAALPPTRPQLVQVDRSLIEALLLQTEPRGTADMPSQLTQVRVGLREMLVAESVPPTRPQDLLKRCKDVIGIIDCDECGHSLALHLDRYGCDYETGDAPCGCKAENLSDDGNDAFVLLKELRAVVADPVRRDSSLRESERVPEPQPDSESYAIAKKIIIDTEVRQLQRGFEGIGTVSDKTSEPLMRQAFSRVWDAARYEPEAGARVPEDGPQPWMQIDRTFIQALLMQAEPGPGTDPAKQLTHIRVALREALAAAPVSAPDWHAFYTESQTALYHEQEVNEELRNKLRAVSAPDREVKELRAWKESAMIQLGKAEKLMAILPTPDYWGWDVYDGAVDYINKLRWAVSAPQPDPQLEQARFEAEFGPVPKGRVSAHTMLRWNHNREGWMARAGGSETTKQEE